MSNSRQNVDGFAAGSMLLLCVIWGLQQIVIKWAAPDIAPVMQLAARSLISALLVMALMRWRGGHFAWRDGSLRPGLLAGGLFALEFLLVAEGLRFTSAAHMAVFLYTSPLFTALGLHYLVKAERLQWPQWLGIGLAFSGIVVAFWGGGDHADRYPQGGLGDILGVLAGAAWGATTVVVRSSRLSEAPPTNTLLYQLLAAVCVMVPYAVMTGQFSQVSLTPVAWASLLFNGIIVSFASYLAWFWLLRKYLASRLAVFSFMTPLFGVTFGVLLLDEPLALSFVLGAVLVLMGVVTVSLAGGRRSAS